VQRADQTNTCTCQSHGHYSVRASRRRSRGMRRTTVGRVISLTHALQQTTPWFRYQISGRPRRSPFPCIRGRALGAAAIPAKDKRTRPNEGAEGSAVVWCTSRARSAKDHLSIFLRSESGNAEEEINRDSRRDEA
jgi:hypothetical protein